MKRLLAPFLCVAIILSTSSPGYSWGDEGHKIVVDLAWNYLNESTRQAIHDLIGDKSLSSYGSWADDYRRDHRDTGPWHYVNISLRSDAYLASRDCPHECVVSKIHDFTAVLADKSASPDKRKEALLFLIHFVGDIHQPMHAVAEAAGGNQVKVMFLASDHCGEYMCNLHGVWDTSLIEHTRRSESDYVAYLERMIKEEGLESKATGTAEDWANESLAAARSAWPPTPMLGQDYYQQNIKIVDQRLALAGLRLARLLNQAMGRTE